MLVLFGQSRSRLEDEKNRKVCFERMSSLFLNRKEPEPVEKLRGAGAGQKRIGSVTLIFSIVPKILNGFFFKALVRWRHQSSTTFGGWLRRRQDVPSLQVCVFDIHVCAPELGS